uniref:Uncharacterized protein n=1 Tax=Rhizophora mucronata TaxID=61149 RepID=A0A2P2NB92_RHIMU
MIIINIPQSPIIIPDKSEFNLAIIAFGTMTKQVDITKSEPFTSTQPQS